jgi:hypothetical protein
VAAIQRSSVVRGIGGEAASAGWERGGDDGLVRAWERRRLGSNAI